MKTFMLITGSGPLMILTSHTSIEDSLILEKLAIKGIEKFIAYEVPYDLAKLRYGGHFNVVANDLHESDDLRVLDYNGERTFKLFSFAELGSPILHEASGSTVSAVA
ncbi:MAG: cytosolic protein [Candidatus Thiodiazotropha endolucinida]|nr:cytosolic protein [Candidatus Thiodiazotropha taylori]MCG8096412.1 cytosolic protein [Candidatus Thiodiazotropha endolucinida]MCG7908551.1 cytosolic protein [Candidatus Thiodiazotropha taylori]MCG7943411.1 cytosolic protein [Candidatus Thiodiazotropha taylori]MCG7974485.1 cytosolic protein [Candidatus Thiodiazotropha taylori]